MQITKHSPFTGVMNTREIDITKAAWRDHLVSGRMIQDSFPDLSPDDREFLMTGYTPEDWVAIFPPEEDMTNNPDGAVGNELLLRWVGED